MINKRKCLRIDRDAIVTENIVYPGLVKIAGVVFGQISAESVQLEITGEIHGKVFAMHADIEGAAYNLISVSGSLIVRKAARINGMIEYHHLMIESGASVNARLSHRIDLHASIEHKNAISSLVVGTNTANRPAYDNGRLW